MKAPSDRSASRRRTGAGFRKSGALAAGLLLLGAAGGALPARAQEFPDNPRGLEASAPLGEMAHDAAGEMELRLPSVEEYLPLIREQSDPILQARMRMRIRRTLRERAIRQTMEAAQQAPRSSKPQEPSVEGGDWRFSVGNNGNWSPYPDRELDARNLSFPMRRDARAEKRTDQQRALDRMRRANR